MTEQTELTYEAFALLLEFQNDSQSIISSWHRAIRPHLELVSLGLLAHERNHNNVPAQNKFSITDRGRDYLSKLDTPAPPEQSHMEQFTEDYPEINGVLEGIGHDFPKVKQRLDFLFARLNDFAPESQVRQDLRVALDVIAEYQECNGHYRREVES